MPQETINNPYPTNSNPLLPILGKGYGGNLGRGGQPLLWYNPNQQKARNDRFNFTFQRQLRDEIVVSGTYFLNIGNQQYTKALNQINPALQTQYQNQLNQQVANPFYHYLNQTVMPGPLYNQQTVSLGSLLVPYPQYGGLYELGVLGAAERYHSLELKAQKAFSKGYNFLVTYVYIREKAQTNGFLNGGVFNDQQWYSNTLTYQDSNQPHHRFNMAGTWELPIGKGKRSSRYGSQGGGCRGGRLETSRALDVHVGRFPAVRQHDRHREPLHLRPHAAALVQHRGVRSAARQHLRSANQSACSTAASRARSSGRSTPTSPRASTSPRRFTPNSRSRLTTPPTA